MKRSTCPTLTSAAALAVKSKRSLSFTEKTRERREVGHGTATALSAVERPVETMGPHLKRRETPGFGSGGKTIPRQQRALMPSATLSKNMVCPPRTSKSCALRRTVGAQSVDGKPVAYSWIIAIRRVTYGRCFARPATPFSAGTSARPALSSNSNATWKSTAASPCAPCHADVMLELANAPTGRASQ